MPSPSGRDACFRVVFDDAMFAEDLDHSAPGGRTAAQNERVTRSSRTNCHQSA
jgi:hypothetical protein